MSEEKQIYTADELEEMQRPDLRKLAVKTWGMDNKECTATKSHALRSWILEQQEGYQNGGNGAGETRKKRGRPKGSKGPKARPSGRPSQRAAKAESEEAPSGNGSSSGLIERVDLLGKTIDSNHEEIKEAIAAGGSPDLQESIDSIKLSLYILHGLVGDIYRNYYDPDELETRTDELEAEYGEAEAEGNA